MVPTVRYPSFVDQLPLTRLALEFAAASHGEQRREADDAPFILHPLEVAHLLHGRDYPDCVVAAGVLHDVIEDTEAEYDELARDFGAEVARLVCAVTEPGGDGGYSERKARLRRAVAEAETDAVVIFAADKVAKAREFRLNLVRRRERDPVQVDPAKLEHYWACLSLLESRLGGHAFVRQFRFELEALELLPPGNTSGPSRPATEPLSRDETVAAK
ncbi:MAG: hypothetical protein AVDCRST_MAG69-1131 [uncultured Solirubrobacteraceae bacterium]|uniref:GTP diphosphokinase n=1 Tax=uncultured Solirubrobacteraceae bacterium TaxID=1162706 RepID=A0A6J4S1D1_9ACTN|nr:MAG: hypothetical protein AVDCRST_MAG69-1131 [uncultured Solirubrobacteraceae bacterium]